jgi:hydroxyacylglutathione hydrolase
MNKTACIVLSYLFLAASCAFSQQLPQRSDLTITKLEDNMWVIETSDHCTLYLVEGTQRAMLIDTGTGIDRLDTVITSLSRKPLVVVLTHAHGDHAGNINFFHEIWMHPADTVLLSRAYKGKVNFVQDGDLFDLGRTQIEVSHMPAHTPGSIVLLDRKAGNCYSGDAFGANHVWLQLKPHSPMQTYVNSCLKMEKLMDSGIAKVYCGHYVYIKRPYDKSYITAMRQLAEALIKGTAPEAQPYSAKVGCANPMSVTSGPATIVFDPDYLRQEKD